MAHIPETPRGVHDQLPEQLAYADRILAAVRRHASFSGFRFVETPVIEDPALARAARGPDAGEVLYTVTDPEGGHSVLRPDVATPLLRAYLQHELTSMPQPALLATTGPAFRHVPLSRGQYRQFHQFAFAAVGECDPTLDAQLIHLAWRIHRELGIDDRFTLQVNSVGGPEERRAFLRDFVQYFEGKQRSLAADERGLLESDPLRLLASHHEDTQILLEMAPRLTGYLDDASRAAHEELLALLTALGVPFVENPSLLRSGDAPSGTVFEFWDATHGAEGSVGGGARMDGLAALLGAPATPFVSYAGGIERLVLHMKQAGNDGTDADGVQVFVAQLGAESKRASLKLLSTLRDVGIRCVGALGKGSMKEQLQLAAQFQVPYALILGQVEVRERTVIVRDMHAGKQHTVRIGEAASTIQSLLTGGTKKAASRSRRGA